jgi:hypothetical protein
MHLRLFCCFLVADGDAVRCRHSSWTWRVFSWKSAKFQPDSEQFMPSTWRSTSGLRKCCDRILLCTDRGTLCTRLNGALECLAECLIECLEMLSSASEYFQRGLRPDVTGRLGITPLIKEIVALHQLAYGIPSDLCDNMSDVSNTTAAESMYEVWFQVMS